MIREMYMYMYLWDAFTCIIVTFVSLSSSLSPSLLLSFSPSPSLLLSFSLPPPSLSLSPSPSPSLLLPPLPSLPPSLPLLLPQVQKVLALTQSPSVLEAIGDLIRARPGDPVLAFSNSSLSTSSPLHIAPERRKLTLRKKLPTPNRIGCNCGKCAKCIPSPSGESLCTCVYMYTVLVGIFSLFSSSLKFHEIQAITYYYNFFGMQLTGTVVLFFSPATTYE